MSDGGQPATGGGIRARFDAARVELLRTLWGPSELPASALGRLRAQQIAAVTKATPLMMCGNIMCALAVVAVFWDTAQMDVLLWWAAIFSGLSGLAIWQWVTRRGLPERATASARAVKRLAWRAVIPALCLSFPTLFLFPSIDDQQRLLISSIVTGSLCVGLFGLSSVPLAALSYASVMVAGAATAMAMTGDPSFIPIGLLLFVYAACALGSVAWYSRLFVDRFTRSLEIEHQSELIGMLLHDFEKQASDWLWEMDAEGRFQLGVQRFAEALGVPSGDLDGRKISDLLAVDQASRSERDAFLEALAGREPFGGLVAPLARGHQTRWLSLTAKPVHDAAGAFIGWRGVASDVTDAKLSERDMRHMAHHDALTGLPNRTALAARLDQAVQVLHERGQPFAVLLIDLDDFKAVNDTLGHGAGDQLLVEMSGKLAAAKPEDALLARLGGDEFALIAPSHGEPDAAEALCARLLATLGSDFDLGGARVMVGGSIGLVIAPQDGIDPETLMRRADLALYRAKADGRRCARRFDDGIEIAARRRRHIEDRLRGAIERGDLALHYQPIVSLKGETVVAAEALMRWRDAELGPISPGEFIPIAEDTGLILPMGIWALKTATRDAARWPLPLAISVNLSPSQFKDPTLCEAVAQALADSGLEPWRLELEVTETALMAESGARELIDRIKSLGVRLSLDDFGTGYSSLSYLRQLPFDKIKIDRSFVREAVTNADSLAIIEMIVGLGQRLNATTTAEGIETAFERQAALSAGCEYGQGWAFGKPLPAVDFQTMLQGMKRAAA